MAPLEEGVVDDISNRGGSLEVYNMGIIELRDQLAQVVVLGSILNPSKMVLRSSDGSRIVLELG